MYDYSVAKYSAFFLQNVHKGENLYLFLTFIKWVVFKKNIEWNPYPSFLKGLQTINDECGKTVIVGMMDRGFSVRAVFTFFWYSEIYIISPLLWSSPKILNYPVPFILLSRSLLVVGMLQRCFKVLIWS